MARFLSGLLGPAINVATNAVSADQGAQANAANSGIQAALQRAQIVKQQRDEAIKQAIAQREAQSQGILDQLHQAQIGDTNQQMRIRQHDADNPKPVAPVLGSPEYVKAEGDVAAAKAKAEAQYRRDPQAPVPHYAIQTVTGADEKVHLAKVNSLTGDVTELPNLGKQPGSGTDATHQMAGDHYGRAKKSSDALDKFGATWATNSTAKNWVLGHNPIDSSIQQANQAGEEFATMFAPILNKGRSTHIEIQQVKNSYVPKFGDSPETIQQKSEARADLLRQYAKYAPQVQESRPVQPSDADAALASQDPGFAAFLRGKGHSP